MKLLTNLKLVVLTALLSSLCITPIVSADDTEIFFGQSNDAFNTNPNVLFLLDTSGSMTNLDGGSTSRMDRMKAAMRILLEESSSYNVGLMGFSGKYKGGSIRYPIGDLESDSGDLCPDGICPDETVVVKPVSSSDDATQDDDTLMVTMDAHELTMPNTVTETQTTTTTVSQEVTGSALAVAISAENEIDGGMTDTRAITTSTKWFYNGVPDTEDDRYAYRFDDVQIPPGATVTSASLSFTQTNLAAQVGNLSALIKLEVNPNPDPLPDGANGYPTIAQRLTVGQATNGVAWDNIPPDTTGTSSETTTAGNVATSPDLSDIINQIVVLPNWSSGNALSFILDPVDEYDATELDVREFKGLDAPEPQRPVLNFTYSETIETEINTTELVAVAHLDEITQQNTGIVSRNLTNPSSRTFFASSANEPRKFAFRFENLDIPNDAEIQTAQLTLTGATPGSESDETDWVVDTTTGTPTTETEEEEVLEEVVVEEEAGGSTETPAPENLLTFNINAENTGTPAPYDNDPIATRELTTQFYSWEDLTITPNAEIETLSLAPVISAVINGGSWSAGDDLSLVLTAPPSYNNVEENSALIQTSTGAAKPKLLITWKAADTTDTTLANSQTTAIRFPGVHVPPQATIKSARLVFNASTASIGDIEMEISAEDNSNSVPLTSTVNNIGERARTPKRVAWEVEPWDIPNVDYYTPELKEVIQSVTNLSEWCSGNPLTLFLKKTSGDASRHAVSFDQNSVKAPTLEITYEPASVSASAYCSNTSILSSIGGSGDDAVQNMETDFVDSASASLDTIKDGDRQIIGLRFPGLAIPKDAAIISATLELTHEKDITIAQPYEIKAVSTLNSPQFNNSDNRIVATSRPTYPTTVIESAVPGPKDLSVFRANVTPLITAKTSDDNWIQGNRIVLTVESLGNEEHSFYAFNGEEISAPRLVVTYQSERTEPGTRFRDNLIQIVDDMVAQGHTPIVSSYYEGIQYFLGEPVDYGLKRGSQYTADRYHRVSHPASYTNGVVNRPSGCFESNLNASACVFETIQPENGLTPTYKSPMVSECQQNHMVVLSDGRATSNTAATKIKNLTGITSCESGGNNACGRELAGWLYENDIDPVLDGKQNITTHTIGFNLDDPELLEDMATDGGGTYYPADSAAQLLNAFKNIFINVSKTDTSFVAPSATVSQANRLKNRDDIYFSLFKPEGTARWAGNLKRYRLGGTEDDNADIYDVNDELAVDAVSGRFKTTAKSFWSDVVDGDSVLLGGAAEKIETNGVSHLARNVYTYTGRNKDLTSDVDNELLPENTYIEREWLGLTSSVSSNTEYVESLLNWAHGKDVFDIDGDSDREEARAQMGDPMHSQPLLVNYAGDRSVIHVTTNEGFLHAIDHNTGKENFAWIPKELLKNIRANFENEPTNNRPYGLDGGMTVWIQDENKNGVVDPLTDKAYLYIGMRRGGNLYYALDITDPDNPKYMWSLQGGQLLLNDGDDTADGDYGKLGETWSKPVKTKILDEHNAIRDVLIFGGGYDANQDPIDLPDTDEEGNDTRQTRKEDSVGMGFYIVDATDGERLFHADVARWDDMVYSVPSELRVIDINFDGLADQIYFGDMGGQVWRFDYNNDDAVTKSVSNRMEGGVIGAFANDTPETNRRFYYPPDIALLSIGGQQQLSISIGSGWRAHPLDDVVEDRFYNIRMKQVYGAPQDADGNTRYPNPVTEGTTGMKELTDSDVARVANAGDRGWFLPMRIGEKVLSSSVTVDGNIVFTSYVPSVDTGSCSAAVGSGSVYFLDAATGNPVKNLDAEDDATTGTTADTVLDANDRRRPLKLAGIPPEATILFPETGHATAFAGRDKLDEVEIETLKHKTFWQEFVEENL